MPEIDLDNPDLEQIRRQLRELQVDVADDELRQDIQDWLGESYERIDADSLAGFVTSRLTQMLAEYDMFNSTDVEAGAEAFPDACSECRHYGSACPVLVGPVEPEWREMRLAQAASETEERQVFQQQAVDTGCKRIPEFLEEWDEDHSAFIQRGEELLAEASNEVYGDYHIDSGQAEVTSDG